MSYPHSKPTTLFIFFFFIFLLSLLDVYASSSVRVLRNAEDFSSGEEGYLVRRDQRRALVQTEYGEISSIDVSDGRRGQYHVQFITMEPNALFLPVLLHADMVFYVHTGSGTLHWAHGEDEEVNKVSIKKGDVHRVRPGSVFFLQSDLHSDRHKLRINAIFANTDEDVYDPVIGAYSSVRDLVRGFDTRTLRSAFKVPEEVIESITSSTEQAPIVHALSPKKKSKEAFWDLEARFLKTFLGAGSDDAAYNKKKDNKDKKHKKKDKSEAFNIFDAKPDVKNCNGWSAAVNERNSPLLRGSNIGLFMVNLTKGSMMGPHWNPRASEISVVLQGEGMVRVVCSSTSKRSECKSRRFRVKEGDVFAVPMFHPMAQMSFNNDSLVFMGFSTTTRRNYPQFLAGKYSVLQTLNREILAVSLNVSNATVERLLAAQVESIVLDCTSCAEEEEQKMLKEKEKEREEEEEKEEEEERKREEEKRKREEEEEEERRKREEEERQRQKEEEERERQKQQEEEEEREQQRQEEEERQRQKEEEEERKQQRQQEEEEQQRQQQEERERQRQKEEEEERERQQQQEEEERERQRQQEEEEEAAAAAAEREQEEEARRQEQEDYRRRRDEEAQTEQEEARRQQEEIEGRTTPEEGDQGYEAEAEAGRREA